MGLTAKKYGVSISFLRKMAFFGKTEGQHLWISSRNLKVLKPVKAYIQDHYV